MKQHKIKKHFSLFMVSKSIHKPNKKHKKLTSIIILQSNTDFKFPIINIPKFLDPFTSYIIFGDVCVQKAINPEGNREIGLLSCYNDFKTIMSVNVENQFISISIEKSIDQLHSWEFLIARLESLNDKSAYDFAQSFKEIPMNSHTRNLAKLNDTEEPNFQQFVKEIDEICIENRDKYFTMLRYRVASMEKGLELKEIRHSRRCAEFFAGDMERFSHLVVEQGLLDIWCVEERDYYPFMTHAIKSYIGNEKDEYNLYANTMEGFKVKVKTQPLKKMLIAEDHQEIAMFIFYEVDEKEFEFISSKRKDSQENKKKSFRDVQLGQLLNAYYNEYIEPKKGYEKYEEEKNEALDYNNVFLSEKKRCGIKIVS